MEWYPSWTSLDQAGLGGLLGDCNELRCGLGRNSRLGSVGGQRARLSQEFASPWGTLWGSFLDIRQLDRRVGVGIGGSLR